MSRPRRPGFLYGFAAGTVLLVAAAWGIVLTEHRHALDDWRSRLLSTALDRASLTAVWLNERAVDAQLSATRPLLRAALERESTAEPAASALDTLVRAYGLDGAALVHPDGSPLIATHGIGTLVAQARATVRAAAAGDSTALVVLGPREDASSLAFVAPVRERDLATRGVRVTGAVLLFVAPERQLAAIVAREKGLSVTGRLLLLRVADGRARRLFDVVPSTGPPPPLGMRLDTAGAVREQLFAHAPGFGEYRDYRRVATFAATAPVPGTGWIVLNRIDRSEAMRDFRQVEALVLVATALAILALWLLVRAIRHRVELAATASSAELARSEVALRESEERYRALVEGSPDMIFALDRAGRFTWLNSAFEAVTGFRRDEWLGRHFRELLDPADADGALAMFERVLASRPQQRSVLLKLRTQGGAVRLGELTGHAQLVAGESVGVLGVCRDITDRVTMEEQLRQSSKIEAVGQLAGGIAHDFNNILTVIIGSSELLLADIPEDNPWRADIEEIRASAGRAATLTRQLLAFSRRQMLAPRVVDLNAVVTGAAGMLRRLIGEHIVLDVRLAPDLAAVVADPGQVEQAIVNLAVNARDAMPRGGVLMIATANVANAEPLPLGGVPLPPGRWSMIEVKDTGTGLSAEARRHLFEPFFTTKAIGKGTGLGLASVYGVIKQSKGFIGVESEAGKGTAFRLYLPASGAQAGVAARSGSAVGGDGHETILLVEDEAQVRAVARETLARRGYRVLVAESGPAALALAEAGAAPDLLLSDVVMPGMSGPDLAARLAGARPALKVLFMSGYAEAAADQHDALGSAPLLHKPFTPEQLALRVRAVLDGKGD